MKWTWEHFGYRVVDGPRRQEPELILTCLSISEKSIVAVHFFESLSRAVVEFWQTPFELPGSAALQRAQRASGWEIELESTASLAAKRATAREQFAAIDGINRALAEKLLECGYLCLDDVCYIDPKLLAELGEFSTSDADAIIDRVDEILIDQDH